MSRPTSALHRCLRPLAIACLGAACLAVPLRGARAQGVPVDQATPEKKAEAQSFYELGVKAFDAKDYAGALAGFKTSYTIVKSPNAHMMMARALLGLGQPVEAYNELVIVEQEAAGQEKYAAAAQKSVELRGEAAAQVAVLTFRVVGASGPAEVRVDGAPVAADQARAFAPGAHVVELWIGGDRKQRTEMTAKAGDARDVTLQEPRAAAPVGPVRPDEPAEPEEAPGGGSGLLIGGIVVTTIGLGGLGVATAFGMMAKSNNDDLVALCGEAGDACDPAAAAEIESLKSDGSTAQTVHWIGLGVGAAGVIAGVTMIIFGASGDDAPMTVGGVHVDVGPGSIGLSGTF